MYKQLKDMNAQVRTDMILRTADGAFIPADPHNTDWQAYQRWLADGNTPTSA